LTHHRVLPENRELTAWLLRRPVSCLTAHSKRMRSWHYVSSSLQCLGQGTLSRYCTADRKSHILMATSSVTHTTKNLKAPPSSTSDGPGALFGTGRACIAVPSL
jgi:hypothetical protein